MSLRFLLILILLAHYKNTLVPKWDSIAGQWAFAAIKYEIKMRVYCDFSKIGYRALRFSPPPPRLVRRVFPSCAAIEEHVRHARVIHTGRVSRGYKSDLGFLRAAVIAARSRHALRFSEIIIPFRGAKYRRGRGKNIRACDMHVCTTVSPLVGRFFVLLFTDGADIPPNADFGIFAQSDTR